VTISAEGVYSIDESGALVSIAGSALGSTSSNVNFTRQNILGNASGQDGEFGFGFQLEVLN